MLRKLIFMVVVIMGLSTAIGAKTKEGETKYPLWFLRMPFMRGVYFAVGYAPRYTYLSSSFKEAKENLKKNLAYVRGVKVEGALGFLKENSEIAGMGGTLKEITDTEGISPVVLDSAVCEGLVLVLGATKKVDDWQMHLYKPPSLWYTELPSSDDFLFAVGTAPIYAYEHDSWLSSEENARENLAMEIFTNVKGLRKYYNGTIEGVTVESTSVYLPGVQVIARHIDRKNGSVYVLVGIPKK